MKQSLVARFSPFLVLSALLVGALALTACGGNSDSNTGSGGTNSPATGAIRIAENDAGFEPRTVTVSRGQRVEVTFANEGTIIHNLRIAGPSGRFGGSEDTVVGMPVLQPGQSATVAWSAPNRSTEVPYRCDVHPDHTGVISVK